MLTGSRDSQVETLGAINLYEYTTVKPSTTMEKYFRHLNPEIMIGIPYFLDYSKWIFIKKSSLPSDFAREMGTDTQKGKLQVGTPSD